MSGTITCTDANYEDIMTMAECQTAVNILYPDITPTMYEVPSGHGGIYPKDVLTCQDERYNNVYRC